MGRKINEERIQRIARAYRIGAADTHAAMAGGINLGTLYEWQRVGNELRELGAPEEELSEVQKLYLKFVNEIDQARADQIEELMGIIQTAAATSWQAAAWKLERLYPQLYGRTTITHAGDPEQPIRHTHKIDLTGFSVEELKQIASALKA